MESWVYTQGKLKGIEEGQAATTGRTLRSVFADRLGRSPTPEEEDAIVRRAPGLPPEQLVTVFKMSGDELIAWLRGSG